MTLTSAYYQKSVCSTFPRWKSALVDVAEYFSPLFRRAVRSLNTAHSSYESSHFQQLELNCQETDALLPQMNRISLYIFKTVFNPLLATYRDSLSQEKAAQAQRVQARLSKAVDY